MTTNIPSFDFIFNYLITHDLDEAKDFFDPGWKTREGKALTSHPIHTIASDVRGNITLIVPDGPLFVYVENPATAYEAAPLKRLPGTEFMPLDKAPGVFYTLSGVPEGHNECWVQQYPPSPGVLEPGRTVVEFYTDKEITGVFKTDVDNFGASGKGQWIPVNRQA